MTLKHWEGILTDAGISDILIDPTYNPDYAHEVTLTVIEIRAIADILKERDIKIDILREANRN